jgi:hypothetical protein
MFSTGLDIAAARSCSKAWAFVSPARQLRATGVRSFS